MRADRVRGVALFLALAAVPVVAPGVSAADEPPHAPRSFTLAVTGDMLAHDAVNAQARRNGAQVTYDYRPMYTDIEPVIAGADLAICHLEGPIAPPGVRYVGQPVFATPPDIAASLSDVGYDRCSTASNHSLDRGTAGVTATIEALHAAGLGHAGTARTADEAIVPIFEVNGVHVAHLAYSYGFNGPLKPPAGEPWWANALDPVKVVADAQDARTRGAEVVVVSLHWGSEFRRSPTAVQRRVANVLTASGVVDVIVGHHAHVVQPIEKINGTWVIFGLGNIVSNQRPSTGLPAASQDGVIVRLRFTERPGGGFTVGIPEAIATWVHEVGFIAYDVAAHVRDPTLSANVRSRLRASLRRTSAVLGSYLRSYGDPTAFSLTPIDAAAGFFQATGTCPTGTSIIEYTWVGGPNGVDRGLVAHGAGPFSLALRMLAAEAGGEIAVTVKCRRSKATWLAAWGGVRVTSGNALRRAPRLGQWTSGSSRWS